MSETEMIIILIGAAAAFAVLLAIFGRIGKASTIKSFMFYFIVCETIMGIVLVLWIVGPSLIQALFTH